MIPPLMLPAWATVVLAIGGAVIGALAGIIGAYFGYRSARANLTHQEREAWRKSLIEAAQACTDAWHGAAATLLHAGVDPASFDQEDKEAFAPLWEACARTLTRAVLLFGLESPTGKAAKVAETEIGNLGGQVAKGSIPWDDPTKGAILGKLRTADHAIDAFIDAAHAAISPSSWKA
jgi:hypothetical protein